MVRTEDACEIIKYALQNEIKVYLDGGCLPGTYNGLGYKNLIKMEFLLAAFAKKIEKCGNACIPCTVFW